jgi:hypothetical protein
MTNSDNFFTITVRKRPWWLWALAELWLLLEVVLVQTALASARESESRAATISWIAATILAAAGAFGWLRRVDSRKTNELV